VGQVMMHLISTDGERIDIDYRYFHKSGRSLYIRISKLMKGGQKAPNIIVVKGKQHNVFFKIKINRTYRDNNSIKYWYYQYEDSDLMAPGECALYTVHVQDDSVGKDRPFPDGFDPDA
jgi:hypothetical protein